jgi:prophage tail gpP-like protein
VSESNRAVVEMRFGSGEVFNAWETLSLIDAFVDPLGRMEFAARPARELLTKYNENLQKGKLVAVMVNGKPQGVQLIQEVRRTIDRGGVTFDVLCHSPLVTPYEASANPDYAFSSKTDVPISSVIHDVMSPFGFSAIDVNSADDTAARLGKKLKHAGGIVEVEALKHQDCQVKEGETAYGVCDRVINRLGLGLRCNVDGVMLLVKPDYSQDPSYTLVQDFKNTTKGDRILDGMSILDSNKGQFSECVVRGQRSDSGDQTQASLPAARLGIGGFRPESAPYAKIPLTTLDKGRHTYSSDQSVAPYKPKFFHEKTIRDAKRAASIGKLIMGLKAKDAFVVTCEVDGFLSREGLVWSINTVARVVAEAAEIDQNMWIAERTLHQDRNGGQKARLTLIPLNSLIFGDVPS